MIPSVYERLHITPGVSAVIVSLALMLIAGFAMTRLTSKLRLPNVTAYHCLPAFCSGRSVLISTRAA